MTATTAVEAEIVSAVDETMTRAEILAHLSEYHRTGYYTNSKTRKGDLLTEHARGHQYAETGDLRWIRKSHTHVGVDPIEPVLPGDVNARVDAIMPTPGSLANLSAADKRALEKVIKSDYDTLAQQVEVGVTQFKAQRRKEVEGEWAAKDKALTEAQAKLNAAAAEATRKINVEFDKLIAAGFVGTGYETRPTMKVPNLRVNGREEALNQIEREGSEALRSARSLITIKRNAAMRSILLAGVSEEAADAANLAVPSVDAIMLTATSQARLALTNGATT